ncbi:MAG: SRPBCC family protein [Microbacterium ginsengisoli]|uniref:SRPBCC family protein n=1 Tax=Microbacterium TaxID=33882 RepID=UPI000700540B|nr:MULTISPECIES: SRPBCC family protein [unclassified Microbacterium]MBN9198008.1 SRPBCC family protein [Microbacterium ginsengisoli]KQR90675.1 cyclase [Microbacterium sp. Leaf351]KQR96871.1 cyclase [Microbacterium sp. Leaf347]ODU77565.1 MAG: cyclase [Microbacterium sp. SCN 71-21]OJU78585.1 MAG: cyclase [Microbacterium sp. 71-23]
MASGFTIVTRTDVPVDDRFDLSLSIDLHLASMADAGERAIAGTTSGRIGLDETVTWRARHFGVWITMTSRISSLDRPHRFVDEQVSGPFRRFRHEHLFEHDGAGTVMTDVIEVTSPVFGAVAERLVLVPYLRRLIRQRNAHLLQAGGG